jgi:ABC-type lipoprotein release transport system permease subunit
VNPSRHWNLLMAAAENVAGDPLRSAVGVLLVTAIVFWVTAGAALSEGLRQQARQSVENGADIYVTLDEFGRDAGPDLELARVLSAVRGVERVVPRIVGRVLLGDEAAVVVGIGVGAPAEAAPFVSPSEAARELRPYQMFLGASLARQLVLRPGSRLDLHARRSLVFEVAGIMDPAGAIWSSDLILLRFDDAAELFGQQGRASDLLLYCREGYTGFVAEQLAIRHPELRVQTRELVERYTQRAYALRQGAFGAAFAGIATLGILAFLVCSGIGVDRRRRQIAILRVHGWSTPQVLEMIVYESLLVSLASAALGFLGAYLWIRFARGALLGGFFIAGLESLPPFELPARFTPAPLLLNLCFSLVITLTGGVATAWRTAATPPAEALR